jgi:small multidrug resistance family-3 protein
MIAAARLRGVESRFMRDVLLYILAAACEIGGCYAVWMWLRLGRTAWWLLPATLVLILFAIVLTRVDSAFAGRAFAAYGGIYIVSSLAWLAIVERTVPRMSDILGSIVCLIGTAIILLGVRWTA